MSRMQFRAAFLLALILVVEALAAPAAGAQTVHARADGLLDVEKGYTLWANAMSPTLERLMTP